MRVRAAVMTEVEKAVVVACRCYIRPTADAAADFCSRQEQIKS